MMKNKSKTTGLKSGSYVLVLYLKAAENIKTGKLGEYNFPEGYYLYTGSALGKNGLAGRLARHIRSEKKLHWHIDYLLTHTIIKEIWYAESRRKLECRFAGIAAEMQNVRVPVSGFGAADCKCSSHLFHFSDINSVNLTRREISSSLPDSVKLKTTVPVTDRVV